ncbi:MAG TPA: LapA family protein [Rectinema sp.]|nr:LapA family protein [Rectinema sp.]
MRVFYIVLLIAVAILAVIFAVQNSVPITVSFFAWSAQASMSIVLVLTFAAGILIGMLLLFPSIWKRMRELSAQKKKTNEAKKLVKETQEAQALSSSEAGQTDTSSTAQDTKA